MFCYQACSRQCLPAYLRGMEKHCQSMTMGGGVPCPASLYSEAMLRFHHKFIAKDNMSITVHIRQAVGNMEEFFHIHRSTFGRCPSCCTVHAFNGLLHINVGAIKSRMFLLIHHLKPDSFNTL